MGAALAVRGGDPTPVRATQPPSVTRFDFLDGPLPPVTAAPGAPAPAAAPAEEPVTAEAAMALYLQSLVDGRPDAAYALLDDPSRQRHPTPASWARAQADLAIPTGFEIGPSRAAFGTAEVVEVEVAATHRPSLDPVRGLVPGRSRSLWQVSREQGAWRVGAQPVRAVPVLPPDAEATAAVSGWVTRLQVCDTAGAANHQAGTYLYGPADFVRAPCDSKGDVDGGGPGGPRPHPGPQGLPGRIRPGSGGLGPARAGRRPGEPVLRSGGPDGRRLAGAGCRRPGLRETTRQFRTEPKGVVCTDIDGCGISPCWGRRPA